MQSQKTPVVIIESNIFVKLEYFQLGGSHKARAARQVIVDAEKNGLLIRDGRHIIIEKTGGNFGIGLVTHASTNGYRTKLLIRRSFSAFKRRMLVALGADLIGGDEMDAGMSNADIIDKYLASAKNAGLVPYYSDQFNNKQCISAHSMGAAEYVSQLRVLGIGDKANINLVMCVGSGASLKGYVDIFKQEFKQVKVVVAQPEGCDFRRNEFVSHPFDGASVGVTPPFFNVDCVDEFVSVKHGDALKMIPYIFSHTGAFVGNTTGLVFAAAQKVSELRQGITIMVAYDSGEPYLADVFCRS